MITESPPVIKIIAACLLVAMHQSTFFVPACLRHVVRHYLSP